MSNDIFENAQKINNKITELEILRDALQGASERKARALSDYRKEKAILTLKLQNSAIKDFEGEEIKYPVRATLIPIIVGGMAYKKAFDRYESESAYKALVTSIDAVRAELNGLQSINRHLE